MDFDAIDSDSFVAATIVLRQLASPKSRHCTRDWQMPPMAADIESQQHYMSDREGETLRREMKASKEIARAGWLVRHRQSAHP